MAGGGGGVLAMLNGSTKSFVVVFTRYLEVLAILYAGVGGGGGGRGGGTNRTVSTP